MKTKLSFFCLILAVTVSGRADGAVNLNNLPSGNPIVMANGEPVPAGAAIYAQVLGGSSTESLTPLVSLEGESVFLVGVPDDGYFDGGIGRVSGVGDNGEGTFQLRAWQHAGDFDSAQTRAVSAMFSQQVGSIPAAGEPGESNPTDLFFPGIMIPEPAGWSLWVAGGILFLLLWRSKR